ncbi:hypothetical protein MKW92_034096, partial [Papaver armeniacum]
MDNTTKILYKLHTYRRLFGPPSETSSLPVRYRRIIPPFVFAAYPLRKKICTALMNNYYIHLYILQAINTVFGFIILLFDENNGVLNGMEKCFWLVMILVYFLLIINAVKIIDYLHRKMLMYGNEPLNEYFTTLTVKSWIEILLRTKSAKSYQLMFISMNVLFVCGLFTKDSTGLVEGVSTGFICAIMNRYVGLESVPEGVVLEIVPGISLSDYSMMLIFMLSVLVK